MTRAQINELMIIIAGSDELCALAGDWTERGYKLTGGRLWRRGDGTATVRLVWRNRAEAVSTLTCVMRGVPTS